MPEVSATLGFPREIRVPLSGNHFSIVKYSSEDDNNFRIVSMTIARLIKDALTKYQSPADQTNTIYAYTTCQIAVVIHENLITSGGSGEVHRVSHHGLF